MRDRLSRQERDTLEQYEKTTALPVFDGESTPTIVERLLERDLLAKDSHLPWIKITERGLSALRGGDWGGDVTHLEKADS